MACQSTTTAVTALPDLAVLKAQPRYAVDLFLDFLERVFLPFHLEKLGKLDREQVDLALEAGRYEAVA